MVPAAESLGDPLARIDAVRQPSALMMIVDDTKAHAVTFPKRLQQLCPPPRILIRPP